MAGARRIRRLLDAGLAAAAGLAIGGGCSPPDVPTVGRAPVVLILLDALHAEHVGHLGYERPTTPAIDALARDGVSFTRAFAPAPYTLASVPSLFTGRLPDTHGLTNPDGVLHRDEVTLAELLGAAGYRTRAAVGNLKGSSLYGLDQGFDTYVELFRPEAARGADTRGSHPGSELELSKASQFPPLVEAWLAQRDGDRPFFYFLHVLEPHLPYEPPLEFRRRFADPAYTGRYADGVTWEIMNAGDKQHNPVRGADRVAARAMYDANLAWADHHVGLVLDLLRDAGLYDEALIVLTSDHGEAFWQHGRWGHSQHVYDEMLRVPLVVKLPGDAGPRNVLVDELASLTDLVPSLCALLDLPVPGPAFDGVSLAPLLFDPRAELDERELLLRTFHAVPTLGLRTAREKTILARDKATGATTGVEHYALDVDPHETEDLAERFPERAAPHVERLQSWSEGATRDRAMRGRPLTAEELELLEKLGYAE